VVYVDFRSRCLIITMRDAGRRLFPDSCRFTLSETQGCLATIVAAAGRGGGAQVGGAFTLDKRKDIYVEHRAGKAARLVGKAARLAS
jgi:hypothetical protein